MRNKRTPSTPPLTPDAAFVVQLHSLPQEKSRTMSGRVEHVVTGRHAKFESATELLDFLGGISATPAPRKRAASK